MNKVESKIYIGIDVSKATLDIWLLPDNHFFQITNTNAAIKKFMLKLKKYSKDSVHIAMESTGGYEKLAARALAESGFKVSIVNPRFIRDFAKSHGTLAKTDKLDAKVIASFCEKMQPKENVKIDKKHDKIADLIARRDQLVSIIIAEKNRLEKAPREIRRSIKHILDLLQKELRQIEIRLKKAVAEHETYAEKHALLTSVKGIGEITATALIAHLPELGTLTEKQIAALAGLAPFNCDSGKMKGRRMIWGGRQAVRTALYMATMSAIRSNPAIKKFYERLVKAGKARMVALTASMRKLIIIVNAMVRNNQPWLDNYAG